MARDGKLYKKADYEKILVTDVEFTLEAVSTQTWQQEMGLTGGQQA